MYKDGNDINAKRLQYNKVKNEPTYKSYGPVAEVGLPKSNSSSTSCIVNRILQYRLWQVGTIMTMDTMMQAVIILARKSPRYKKDTIEDH